VCDLFAHGFFRLGVLGFGLDKTRRVRVGIYWASTVRLVAKCFHLGVS
jgi:hypothetical protein